MYGRGGAQMSFGPPETPESSKNLRSANGGVFILQLLGRQLEQPLYFGERDILVMLAIPAFAGSQ